MSKPTNLLIVEDDEILANVLARNIGRYGYETQISHSLTEAKNILSSEKQFNPDGAIIDLCLGEEQGTDLIDTLLEKNKNMIIIMLTGYGSIATAVESIKRGAKDYLTKPVDIQMLLSKLAPSINTTPDLKNDIQSPSLRRLEWEYIHQTLKSTNWNISLTAKKLGMHRRTLQRKLKKYPVKK